MYPYADTGIELTNTFWRAKKRGFQGWRGFGHGLCDSGKTCPRYVCAPPPPHPQTEHVPYAYNACIENTGKGGSQTITVYALG